jgi:hypothetical protein
MDAACKREHFTTENGCASSPAVGEAKAAEVSSAVKRLADSRKALLIDFPEAREDHEPGLRWPSAR